MNTADAGQRMLFMREFGWTAAEIDAIPERDMQFLAGIADAMREAGKLRRRNRKARHLRGRYLLHLAAHHFRWQQK